MGSKTLFVKKKNKYPRTRTSFGERLDLFNFHRTNFFHHLSSYVITLYSIPFNAETKIVAHEYNQRHTIILPLVSWNKLENLFLKHCFVLAVFRQ